MSNYMDQLTAMRMNPNPVSGKKSPHKAVMMLAVIDMVASGDAEGNRIEYCPELLERFRRYFDVVKTNADSFSPILPFFHLRSSPFWHHRAVPGKEAVCEALSGPGGQKKLAGIIDSAFLDDELFALLQQPAIRQEMREALICRYFPSKHDELMRLADQEEGVGLYAQVLRGQIEKTDCVKEEPDTVRDLAFARVVKRAYHYQCAACGLRILFDGVSLVDAAHIIPFALSHDDDPCNGMALCKNHHWAMDQELIFPCSDNLWHVRKDIDDRVDSQRSLIDLHGKSILSPEQKQFAPKQQALAWREQRLRAG
jgi:putative restriction endonuclease